MLSPLLSSLFHRNDTGAAGPPRDAHANRSGHEPLTRGGRLAPRPAGLTMAPAAPTSSSNPTTTTTTMTTTHSASEQQLLPEIDEAPFSSMFGSSFDRATVESAAQLADSSIFITASGRFRLQRIAHSDEPTRGMPAYSSPSSSSRPTSYSSLPQPIPPSSQQSNGLSPSPSVASHARRIPNHDTTRFHAASSLSDGVAGLRLDAHGFPASALYTQSDGGAQAAEILTDSLSAGRLASSADASPHSPHPRDEFPLHGHHDGSYFGYGGVGGSSRAPGDYSEHTFTNPDPFSPPAYAPSQHPFSSSGFIPAMEKAPVDPRSPSLPSLMEMSSPVVVGTSPSPNIPLPGSPLSTTASNRGSVAGASVTPTVYEGGGYFYDTQTPIVVDVSSSPLPTQPPATAAPLTQTRTAQSGQMPDNSSVTTRDNVLPGEDVLYDGPVESAHAAAGPFESGHLKVFRNNLSADLRFHCKVGNNTDNHWMKGTKAQLVPVYAYDQRSGLIVFIRDRGGGGDDDEGTTKRRHGSVVSQQTAQQQHTGGPSAIYRFAELRDLFRFQSQLTGESVVLDISSVKWIRLARASSRTAEVQIHNNVRLQIWHEAGGARRGAQSDVASFVTAGTALSGPLRERTMASSSRLMVFLGRSEEYITAFITDDVEMEPRGPTSARLKPRKYGGIYKRNSRPGIRARLETKTGPESAASLAIHGESYNPDVEQTFELYKTFEIEFESEPSQANFRDAWNEAIEERRRQRARLAKIQEEMRRETFTPREALSIKT